MVQNQNNLVEIQDIKFNRTNINLLEEVAFHTLGKRYVSCWRLRGIQTYPYRNLTKPDTTLPARYAHWCYSGTAVIRVVNHSYCVQGLLHLRVFKPGTIPGRNLLLLFSYIDYSVKLIYKYLCLQPQKNTILNSISNIT